MKTIKIPKFFHELLGPEQVIGDLVLVLAFTLGSALVVGYLTYDDWSQLEIYQMAVLGLLYLDIAGGVLANLTRGTDLYYAGLPKARLVFIAIHIQPIILGFLVQGGLTIGMGVWFYTILGALILNHLRKHPVQRTLAGTLMASGLMGLLLAGDGLNPLVIIIYMLYMIKVLFSFSVFHRSEVV